MASNKTNKRTIKTARGAGSELAPARGWAATWINTKDSLPETGKEVLTYSCYGFVVGTYGTDGKWDAKDTDYESGEPWLRDEGTVTHWLPLPEPPIKKLRGGCDSEATTTPKGNENGR